MGAARTVSARTACGSIPFRRENAKGASVSGRGGGGGGGGGGGPGPPPPGGGGGGGAGPGAPPGPALRVPASGRHDRVD